MQINRTVLSKDPALSSNLIDYANGLGAEHEMYFDFAEEVDVIERLSKAL